MEKKYRIGILGSGKGSNMVAIADACASGQIPVEITLVISDVAEAGILTHARERQIPNMHIPPGPYRTKLDEAAERGYCAALMEAEVDLIVLAGFMRVLKSEFMRAFAQKIINIHPSLLPAFPGLAAWKQALEYGVKFTGCTIHFVDQGVDTGPIISQEIVPVKQDDTPESLHERIQVAERKLYPEVIGRMASGLIHLQGRRVIFC